MHVSHGNGSQIERGSTPPHHPEPGGPAAQNHPEKKKVEFMEYHGKPTARETLWEYYCWLVVSTPLKNSLLG